MPMHFPQCRPSRGGRVVRRRRGLSVGIRGSYSPLLRSGRAGRCVQCPGGLDAKTYVREPDEDFVSMLIEIHSRFGIHAGATR